MKKTVLVLMMVIVLHPLYAQVPLSLDSCRRMALKHNKTLQIANETLNAAEQMKKAAFTQFFPNFGAVASYSYNQKGISLLSEDALLPVGSKMADGSFGFTPSQISNSWTMVGGQPVPLDAEGKPFDPSTNPEKIIWKEYAYLPKESMEFDVKNVFAGGISFVQPVYMGGKIREMYKMSKYAEQLASTNLEDKTADLLVEVDEAYWRVISLENKVKLAQEYRNLLAKMDSNVSVMIEEGLATRADALKVKVKLNEADMSLTKADNGLSLSRMVLNQLCGMPLETQTPLEDMDVSTLLPPPVVGSISQAIDNRPEIRSLSLMGNIAKSNEHIARSRFLPNIALTGNYLLTNPNVYNGFENKFGGMFSASVVATVPLVHFGDRVHTLKAARAETRIVDLQLQEAREKIELQINQSAFRINESTKKQIACARNMDQADENLRTANEGFDAGVITSTDLLAAQTAWLSAKSDMIDAGIDVRLCRLYLEKNLGTLSPASEGIQLQNQR
jgi:outer membrane protein TolC